MKLTKQQEAEVMPVYTTWWKSYLNGDVKTYDHFLDDEFRFVGSTEAEAFLNRLDTTNFFDATADQLAGKAELRNSLLTAEYFDGIVFITELADTYLMFGEEWAYYGKFRFSSMLKKNKDGWRFIYQHFSTPDLKAQEGETIGIEQVSAENQELRDAIKRRTVELENKSRELEIEASLERVRTVAMGMTKPDDLLHICRQLFQELKSLGFDELRNTMIHTFFDESMHFMNYDFSDAIGGSITRFQYLGNPIIEKFIKDIRKENDAFSEIKITGKEMEDWKAFRKSNGEHEDARLDNIPALYYYNYSVGESGIGISTYAAIRTEKLNILERFRNVFDLAYKRYTDITKAEAQTREAQIEIALERVRSKSLAMHHTAELQGVIHAVHQELLKLHLSISGGSFIVINSEIDTEIHCWGSGGTADTSDKVHIPLYKKPFYTHLINGIKNGPGFFTEAYTQEEKIEFFTFLFQHKPWSALDTAQKKEILAAPGGYTRSCAVSKHTSIFIINHFGEKFSEAENAILKRFGKVFEQSYSRFLDLQKAEAQAREAQIELALERVRARTMAMQKSEELKDVIQVVYDQFIHLKIIVEHAGFIMDYKERDDMFIWLADKHLAPSQVRVPYIDSPHWNSYIEAKKTGKDFFANNLGFKEKNKFYQDLFEFIPGLPDETKEYYFNCPGVAISTVLLDNICLYIENFDGIPYSDEENKILMRFGKVFQQTYTRFLDLQKAESQAREAQIETALEKIRSRTMGMQRSEELKDAALLLFQQIDGLGLPPFACGFNIWDDDRKAATAWMGSVSGILPPFKTDSSKDIYLPIYKAAQNGEQLFVIEQSGKDLEIHYEYLASIPTFRDVILPDLQKKGFSIPTYQIIHCAFFSQGYLMFITYEPAPKAYDIFKRFAKVFEQTYTRFLDLQKAEAQAREAQIEAALERVRSRTMAMQRSEELAETSIEMFRQMKALGMRPWACGFNIFEKDEKAVTQWMSGGDGDLSTPFTTPLTEDPFFIRIYEARQRREELFVMESGGQELEETYKYMFSLPGSQKALGDIMVTGFEMPKFQISHCAFFSQGYLMFITYEPYPEAYDIFKRFAKVFEQTYTRFLDLQKAEAQAREAQIQLALERVRARTMAMQSSEELAEVSYLLNKQVVDLGIPTRGCAFNIYNEHDSTEWFSNLEGTIPAYKTPRENIFLKYYDAGQRGETLWIEEFGGDRIKEHYKYLATLAVSGKQGETIEAGVAQVPEYQIDHVAYFRFGYLLFITLVPAPEAHEVFRRFAKEFEQTYTRFLDLQKAEAQVREAQIEAALEKVRSRSLAMHKPDELGEVVGIVLEKLQEIGITNDGEAVLWERKEGSRDTIIWLASDQNFSTVKFFCPYLGVAYDSYLWDQAEKGLHFFAHTFSYEEKNEYYDWAFVNSDWKYLPDERKTWMLEQESISLSVAWTEKSGITIPSYANKILTEQEGEILLRFSKVFEQAYTRFLDLQKAEAQAREAQIEAALEKVRSRSLAMHTPNELGEVVTVIVEKLKELSVVLDANGVVLCTYFSESKDVLHWIASPDFSFAGSYLLPHFDHPIFNDAWQSRESGALYFSKAYSIEDKNSFWKYAFEHSDYRHFPEDFKQWVFQNDQHILSFAWQKNSAILIPSHTGVVPSAEEVNILKRFAKVFEQSYTRFLDLQKAEAQAREAKIETALEKVRSRSLAMHKSEELNEVVSVLFERLKELKIPFTAIGIGIYIPGSKDLDTYVCGENEAGLVITNYRLPYFNNQIPKDLTKALEKQLDFFVGHYSKEEKDSFYNYVLEHTPEFGYLPEDIKRMIFDSPTYTISMVAVKNAVFNINDFEGKVLAEKEVDIIKRFARVFDQAYTRFLDLQKAEAQARKSQIEAALERVRAQTMAMHNSEDVGKCIVKMFGELTALGVDEDTRFGIGILNHDNENNQLWTASKDGEELKMHIGNLDMTLHPLLKSARKAWKAQVPLHQYVLEGEDLLNYYQVLNDARDYPLRIAMEKLPERQFHYGFVFDHGFFYAFCPREFQPELIHITQRFSSQFAQTYRRYLDLVRAEAQTREAQIEAALERVRSASMAMHKTEELRNVVEVVFHQLSELKIPLDACWIHIFEKKSRDMHLWIGTAGGQEIYPEQLTIPYFRHPIFDRYGKARQNSESFFTQQISRKSKDRFIEHMASLFNLPKTRMEVMQKAKGLDMSTALSAHASLSVYNYRGIAFSEEENKVLQRVSSVFEQAYTRFLDLQNAEAQAREAQIETALEKVRSRTMAMQSSEELPEVANLLFTEVRALGINAWSCGYNILAEDKKTATCSMSSEGTLQTSFQLRLWGEASFDEMGEFIRNDKAMLVQELGGEALVAHYAHMKSFPDLKPTFDEIDRLGLSLPTYQINHLCKFNHGFLLFITYEKVPDAHEIFKRFTKVFDQTYTRFLDLQKAEAQAKEAQIEAALERVRSRTMGMQKAEELGEVAAVLFREMNALVDNLWTCGFVLCEHDRQEDEWWLSLDNGMIQPLFLPNVDDFAHSTLYEGWEKGDSYRTVTLENGVLQEHYNWLMNIPITKKIFEEMEASGIPRPNWQRLHAAYFKTGYLVIITEVPCIAEEIFKRFAQVFDLTYTRFLDLQKAEVQAREAQIENALEKVRSRSLAMQSPNELIEVAQLLREEMGALGVEELETSSIYIQEEESGNTQCWFTIKDADNPDKSVSDQMTINLKETSVGRKMDAFYSSAAKQTSIVMKGKNRMEWIRYCEEKSNLFSTNSFYGETIPERTYHLYKFSDGFIGAAAPGEISQESKELLRRATNVFSFAYTRFRDLQMAEASARASLQQASLDRVRADISSMRNANDLERITPLVFHELTTLGIPFIRCGVFIVHEKKKKVAVYLSSPDGKSLAAMNLPFGANEMTAQSVEAWKKEEVYVQHWDRSDFVNWGKSMQEQGYVKDLQTYQGTEAAPESLHLHFVPFAQGLLYVGSTKNLEEDQINLVKALARSFAIAYARYEDFIKLEQAKTEVESAMNELKATQSQLIQQEKLASLGQLTAGIAHEIKNPLNFVNNFSDLSIELIEEVFEELESMADSDSKAEIRSILEDVKSNLEKIYAHGTRADGIVKSMLQHSRGGSGKPEPTDLNALVKEYVNLSFHGMRAGKNPINVKLDLALDAQLGTVLLIGEDFSRVVLNLCNNAFDAMREKTKLEDKYHPVLTVLTEKKDNQVVLSVTDNGPGIAKEIQDKILQPFFTTKKGTEGTGLGLSITHDIIKAHGGNLALESTIGQGTTFTISIPNN